MKISFLLFLIFLISACNSGNIQMMADPRTDVASGDSATTSTQGNLTGPVVNQSLIYFEQVNSEGVRPSATGIGFLSPGATSPSPFSIGFANPAAPESVDFSPTENGVVYLKRDASTSSIVSLEVENFHSTAFHAPEAIITSIASTFDGKMTAWTDGNGKAYLADPTRAPESATPLDLGGRFATRIDFAPDQRSAIVATLERDSTGISETLLVSVIPGISNPVRVYEGSLGAIDPDSSQIAFLTAKAIVVVDLASNASRSIPVSAVIRVIVWRNNHELVVQEETSDGNEDLVLLDTKTSARNVVASVALPAGTPHAVVCPTFSGDQLYFGDYQATHFLIRRVNLARNSPAPETFAEPSYPGVGYICPKARERKGN